MISRLSFSTRLTVALALLLLAFGAFVAVLARHVATAYEEETLQRLSHGLARHIVEHWPEITSPDRDEAERAARSALLSMLMTVNPGVQVYLLDADGRVQHYIGEPGMVRQQQVDLDVVRAFLGGAALPLRGTDPMGSPVPRIFSAAMFPPRPGDARPPGYLYVVLDGRAREQVSSQLSQARFWQSAAAAALAGLLLTMAVGGFAFRRLTGPLHQLAGRLRNFSMRGSASVHRQTPTVAAGDEVAAIDQAFKDMAARLEAQAMHEQRQVASHREMMAGVAHDLRTPLTALHGHLEALAGKAKGRAIGEGGADGDGDGDGDGERSARALQAALAQSRKVGRLSQQLFELAALQSTEQVLHSERFCLDELVTDAVQKFELSGALPAVTLGGVPPGRLELDGDLQLIERALTNLIDNALRHAHGATAVCVSLRRHGAQAEIVVEDGGPGLPGELHLRLQQGLSLRDPPVRRTTGGIGGLGLAIAQRVAILHGGSLRPLPTPQGGTRLCLALPLAPG